MLSAQVSAALALLTSLLKTAASVSKIGALPVLVSRVPSEALLTGHCLAVAGMSKSSGSLASYVQGFCLAFGGQIVSAFFLGTLASSALMTSNTIVLYWTACWWLVNYNPIPLLDDLMALPAVGIAARACLHTLRALTIAATTNGAAATYKGVVAPAIVAGTLAGCGGKLLSDSLDSVSGGKGKFELKNPGFLLRSSVVNASLVYVLVHYLKAFSVVEATGLVLASSLAYTLSDDITGNAIDVSSHVANAFSTVISPKALLSGGPVKAAVAAATGSSTPKRSSSKKRSKTPSRK